MRALPGQYSTKPSSSPAVGNQYELHQLPHWLYVPFHGPESDKRLKKSRRLVTRQNMTAAAFLRFYTDPNGTSPCILHKHMLAMPCKISAMSLGQRNRLPPLELCSRFSAEVKRKLRFAIVAEGDEAPIERRIP